MLIRRAKLSKFIDGVLIQSHLMLKKWRRILVGGIPLYWFFSFVKFVQSRNEGLDDTLESAINKDPLTQIF